jgi:hypothetical protein
MDIFPLFGAGPFYPLYMLEVGREYQICNMRMYGTPADHPNFALLQDSFETFVTELRPRDYECLPDNVMSTVNNGWFCLRTVVVRKTRFGEAVLQFRVNGYVINSNAT